MTDPARVRELFSQMNQEEQDGFISELSDDEAQTLLSSLKQPPAEQQSFMGRAADYASDLATNAAKQTAGFIPSMARGVNRGIGGIIQTGAEGLENAGLIDPGRTREFTGFWNKEMMDVPGSGGEYRNPVGEFSGEVLPYLAAPVATLPQRMALGTLPGLAKYGEQGPITPEERLKGGAIGTVAGLVSKPVSDVLVAGGRVIGGAAQSIFNRVRGTADPYAPLYKAMTPVTQRVIGMKEILSPSNEVDLQKNIKAASDWMDEADAIHRITGKKPEILMSSEYGSRNVAAAESTVLKSSAADKALNKLTEMQDDAVAGVTHVAGKLRKAPMSPAKAGTAIYNAHIKYETQLTKELEEGAARNYGKIRDQFGDFPMINFANTKKTLLDEAKEQARSANHSAARSLTKAANDLGDGSQSIDAVLKYRKARARNARGVGSIAGLGPQDTADIAGKIVKSINDDILDAGARSGNPAMEAELKLADTAYREGYTALRKARESTLGRLVNVKGPSKTVESINKRARLSAEPTATIEAIAEKVAKMKPSELNATLRNLRSVDPTIDKRVGRYMIDRALKASERGGERMETEAAHNITKLYDELKSSNAFGLIRDPAQRKDADSIMKWLSRAADRSGGGAPIDPSIAATKNVAAVSTAATPFVILAAGRLGMAPLMERALFTEGGRRAMKVIMKYPDVNPALYAKSVEYMMRQETSDTTKEMTGEAE